jgi:hypothetical protein
MAVLILKYIGYKTNKKEERVIMKKNYLIYRFYVQIKKYKIKV